MKPLVEVRNLFFAYQRQQNVLHDVTLDVGLGSFYGLLGRNGAGKSTLLKILAGILVPRDGSTSLLGCDSLQLGVEQWRNIGFVSETQPLYNWMTGQELLDFTRQLYLNWDDAFCAHLCHLLDLPLQRKVGRYSKGERMKFVLLLAMAFRPRLLLLDEPFSGLDVVAKEQLITCLLEATKQEQWSVVCASHDLAEIERLADVIGIIDHGSLVVSESLDSLQARYRRAQVFGTTAGSSANFDAAMLQPKFSENGLTFIESSFSDEREQRLRQQFGPRLELTPMPLREILLSIYTSSEARA